MPWAGRINGLLQSSSSDSQTRTRLERGTDDVIKRHNLRCVSCKSCAQACPFGTIYAEMLGFYQVHCDGCAGAREKACVMTCRQGTMEYRVVDPDEEGVYIIDQYLAARAPRWVRREAGAEEAA